MNANARDCNAIDVAMSVPRPPCITPRLHPHLVGVDPGVKSPGRQLIASWGLQCDLFSVCTHQRVLLGVEGQVTYGWEEGGMKWDSSKEEGWKCRSGRLRGLGRWEDPGSGITGGNWAGVEGQVT